MVATLAPGASEAQLDEAEASLGAPMPPALRVLYRLVNGQELEFDRQREAMPTVPVRLGLVRRRCCCAIPADWLGLVWFPISRVFAC